MKTERKYKYPVNLFPRQTSTPEVLDHIMDFHVPKGSKIWDPTAGGRRCWWEEAKDEYRIRWTDKNPDPGIEAMDIFSIPTSWPMNWDAIFYDPPYLVLPNAQEQRKDEYIYRQRWEDFVEYIGWLWKAHGYLNPGGKIIVKCSDQFDVRTREINFLHVDWYQGLLDARFRVVDMFIHHQSYTSPTAWQVKDRPCSIFVHTVYWVGVRDG